MNVIPPVPTPVVFNAGTVSTESVKRDNTQREVIPAPSSNESSSAEKGLGSESDRVKTPGQTPAPVTYEKPTAQTNQQVDGQSAEKDNAEDASAGKEDAEGRQQEQAEQAEQKQTEQKQAEQKVISELKQRDSEVRAHEQAHAAAGGQYAGSPKYEYEKGPDGRSYAVNGEVSIDVSKEPTPEETIRKAQQVKASALSPVEPSPQDLRVATEATQLAVEARTEIAAEKAEKALEGLKEALSDSDKPILGLKTPGQLELDLVDNITGIDISSAPRKLSIDDDAAAVESEVSNQAQDLQIAKRVSVIENFYSNVSQPHEEGLKISA